MTEIALVGPFHVPSFALQIARRVLEAELHDRCPGVRVRVFAPDDGAPGLDPVEVFRAVDPRERAAFGDRFHRIVVVGDPAVAAPFIDPARNVTRIEGDLALLAPRWYPPALLAQRREFLVAMGWWPAPSTGAGTPAVVQGDATVPPSLASGALRIDAEPGDERTHWTGPRCSLGDGACVDDLVTAIASSGALYAGAASVRTLGAAFRDHHGAPAGGDADTALLVLDTQIDGLCRDAGEDPEKFAGREVEALRRALDARGRRLAAERSAMADRVWEIERRLEGDLAARDAEIAALTAERDALRDRIEVRARAALGRAARKLRDR